MHEQKRMPAGVSDGQSDTTRRASMSSAIVPPQGGTCQVEKIPPELRQFPHWVVWRTEERDGKETKVPYSPKTGYRAKSNDPSTWTTLETALTVYQDGRGHDGIGFVFAEGDGLAGIDLDHCLSDGVLAEWAGEIVAALDSYTERSPGGDGLHVIVRGKLPAGRRRKDKGDKGGVEMYDAGRYFTVTGDHWPGTPEELTERQAELQTLHGDLFGDPLPVDLPRPSAAVDLDDVTIIAKAKASANGAAFSRLWEGDPSGYKSHSEADLALCSHLAFWTGGDPTGIERLFSMSGLAQREKWRDRPDYRQRTIEKALEDQTEFYQGPKAPDHPQESKEAPALEAMPEISPHHLTDLGNARRLVARHGDDLRYCGAWNRWLVWDGTRWAIDDTGEVERRAKDTVASMYAEASRLPDEGGREAVGKHALKSESAHRLGAMVKLAQSELQIVARPSDFDRSPWLLNMLNGTLDLRTGELHPHRQEDFITKLGPVAYDPDAQCPLWLAFLARIMDGNEDLIRFLQRHTGYALTGDTSEQCAFFHYGTGANGKTTFSQTIATAMGDYALQTPVETLLVKRHAGIPNDLARLRGARLVTAAEAEEGQRLAESLVKQMTGGDKLAARFLHAEFFEFVPRFKVLLSTNHKPVIRGTDYAIWRRIRLVPFTVTIPEKEQDKNLGEKLLAELPGILAWAVRGCLDWQREGLDTPKEVKQATKSYKVEMDLLAGFLEDCTLEEDNARVQASVLYKAYTAWCKDNGEKAMNRTRFGRRLAERGLDKEKGTYVHYLGIGLLTPLETSDQPTRTPQKQDQGEIPL